MKSSARWLVLMFFLSALASAARGDGERVEPETKRKLLEQYKTDPEHYARLRQDLQDFLALPADRQEELRRLDRDLHEGKSATSAHLRGVLDRYVDWLQRLPEVDRKQIETAPNPIERLRRVRVLREREWVNQLPKATRQELQKLPAEQQPARIAELRRDERDRRVDWQGAIRHRDDVVHRVAETSSLEQTKPPAQEDSVRKTVVNGLEQLKPAIQAYVTETLIPMLSQAERTRLRQTDGKWPEYGQLLVELAEKHPMHLPGPSVGPKKPHDLPPDLQKALTASFRRKPKPMVMAHLIALEGKWPEYAVAVTQYAHNANIGMAKQLGPSRLSDFSPNLRAFCEQKLFPVLTPEERAQRDKVEGYWPEYPRAIRELAMKHGLQVPGIGLPGPPGFWNRFRVQSSAKN